MTVVKAASIPLPEKRAALAVRNPAPLTETSMVVPGAAPAGKTHPISAARMSDASATHAKGSIVMFVMARRFLKLFRNGGTRD